MRSDVGIGIFDHDLPPRYGPAVMPTFEYMRLRQNFRGCEATGPGSDKFADIQSLDAMLAALGADGWELVTAQTESDAKMYLFKRQVG